MACAPGQKLGAALFWSLILKARKAVALEAESHTGYYEGADNAARLLHPAYRGAHLTLKEKTEPASSCLCWSVILKAQKAAALEAESEPHKARRINLR